MSINLQTYPYFDDFDASKGFHKILFHPAKPVQARELTQMQSILQEQIKRHGDHAFKNGTVVIPGHIFYDNTVKFLKVESTSSTNIDEYIDQLKEVTIIGDATKVTALVVHYDAKTATDPATLYIKYTSASGDYKEFQAGETLTSPDLPGATFKALNTSTYTGSAAICGIGEGVYYVNGYFVGVNKQTVTVSKYNKTSSAIIGLDYIESIVTENEDESLFDNAFGFTNYGAPGAHRLKISLTLSKKPYSYTIEDTSEIKFIDLLKIKNGNIEYLKNDTKYAEIEKWLARRTYEESGDYVVTPFSFNVREYRNNDRGSWVVNTPYLIGDVVENAGRYYVAMTQGYSGASAPTHLYGMVSDGIIFWNLITEKRGMVNGGRNAVTSTLLDDHVSAADTFVVETSPGKAYVRGFEVDLKNIALATVAKARKTKFVSQAQFYAPSGTYVEVTNIQGLPNVSTSLSKVTLKDVSGNSIGTAFVRSLEYDSGVPGNDAIYKLFLFKIAMNKGKNFVRDVASVVDGTTFSAMINPTLKAISGSASASGTAVTGVGTYFNWELSVGDRIKVGSVEGIVTSITSPTSLTSTNLGSIASGASIYKATSELIKLGDYITKIPAYAVSSLRDSTGAVDMEYTITKSFTFTTALTSYDLTLSNGETFLPDGHVVAADFNNAINAGYSLNGNATQLTISGLSGVTTTYKVLAKVKRTGSFAKEKTKTLSVSTITLTDSTTQKYNQKVIYLGEADVIKVIKVTMSGDPTNKAAYVETGEVDITSRYVLDNGQRPEYYDLGSISTSDASSRPIRITFEYFSHSDGDYFSVDSYSSVPDTYNTTFKLTGVNLELRDCLDFRSRINDAGTAFDDSTGGAVSDPIVSNTTMSSSYSYYLPRTDEIGISSSGTVTYVTGGRIVDGMKLATIEVSPYTRIPKKDVVVLDDQVFNYKMSDIRKVDSRLNAVEYYVSLSLMERETVNTSIKDEFGLEVDKQGFLVDAFEGFKVSDIANSDFKISIDFETNTCRAVTTMNGLEVIEPIGTSEATRASLKYQMTDNQITLPYTEEVLIDQTLASTSEYVQSYAIIDYTGVLTIYPSIDNYSDTKWMAPVDDPASEKLPNWVNPEHEQKTSYVYGGISYDSEEAWNQAQADDRAKKKKKKKSIGGHRDDN